MDEPKDLPQYTAPKQCKWEEDGMKCQNKAVKDSDYCRDHADKAAEGMAMGSIAGSGIGALLANPAVLIVGAVIGAAIGYYIYTKDK